MRRPAGAADPVLLALVLGTVLLFPLFLTGLGGDRASWTAQTAIDLLDVYFAWRLATHPDVPAAGRRFWRAVIIACGACAAGDAFQTMTAYAGAGDRISVVQTALVVTGMAIAVGATLRHPLGGTGRRRLRLWLDAATVLTGVAVFLWYFLLADELGSPGDTGRWGAAATTLVMLLIAFGLLKLIFSGTAPFTRTAGMIGCLGLAGTSLGASVAGELFGDALPTGVLALVQLLPCVIMLSSLRLQLLHTRPADPARDRTPGHRPSRLPYLAVIATQILLVCALRGGEPGLRTWGVAVGAVAITTLVLGRQLSAVRDNERLVTELDQQREWFQALVQNTSDLTLVVSREGVVRYASPAAERVLGVDPADLVGTSLYERTYPDDLPTVDRHVACLIAEPGQSVATQVRWRHADGTYRWLDLISTDLHRNQNIRGVVINARDASETRALHDELQRQATHDALTGLANRVLLQRRIDEVAETAGPAGISMLLIDLDGFKAINDRHGHHTGDQVLVRVAERLAGVLGAGEVAARLGGDEFAVLLPGAGPDEAARLAERIAVVVAEPMMIGEQWLTVGASAGVASGLAGEGDRLLREADAAMYRRKHDRKANAQPVR
ncbi:sensor domain-containing diguanylate cyclase [Actinoplanes oblitus]|uniref:Sensor domain-containing diguanylate cyclase n=1 Tax=Actinoplanes oblitus TaxID=3040509 RepID=A0ABY8WII9_9ACTN|nr:sensor domain-containing diguanylate cyclase [Actinoplanes oblitus]WIM97493.1 sensor domain-containing diguanylate cyclase [Actinoplanes oblitus]